MFLWVLFKPRPIPKRAVDLRRRDSALLGASVAEDRTATVEEIKHPVLDGSLPGT
jgi:hypothetical protein